MTSTHSASALNASLIHDFCRDLSWISQVDIVEHTESTNADLMFEAARSGEDGKILVAETQTRGRGRRGRAWLMEPYRDLAFSMLLRPQVSPEKYPLISFEFGLAIFDALREFCGRELSLKWPNDLLLGGLKVAGMLSESMPPTHSSPGTVVVGVGINLNSRGESMDPELRSTTTSIALHTGQEVDRTLILKKILKSLNDRRQRMERGSVDVEAWNRHAAWIGEKVVVQEDGKKREGTFLGILADGSMRLQETAGSERHIICGDVVRLA